MSRCFTRISLVLVVLLLAAVPRASAEPIQWNYTGSVVTTGPSLTYGSHVLVGNGSFIFQAQFADVTGAGTGSTSVNAFQMRTSPTAIFDGVGEGTFLRDVHTFDLTVGLTDATSGKSGSLIFNGGVDGFVNRVTPVAGGGPSGIGQISMTHLDLSFSNPSSQSLVLANHLFKVSIDPFTFTTGALWPPPPGTTISSGPSAYRGVPIQVQVSDVPEPSTLALAAAGLAGLGLRAWRRRRVSQSPVQGQRSLGAS
jgi:MYXO-CTERM domain-containing protein